MGVMEDIGRGPVGLDTVVFIYFIEEHVTFLPLVEPVFAAIDTGVFQLAAALAGGCRVYLTNDRELPSIPGLRILQLRDYTPPSPPNSNTQD